MTRVLLLTLGLSLGVQAVFFAFAATLRTDKVTDLSYGLTFIVVAAALLAGAASWNAPRVALALMVIAWGARLAGYLVYRIIHMGRDARFDGIRERFWKFFQFWFFQGIAVWIIMLPVIVWFTRSDSGDAWLDWMTTGALIWLAGLVIETIADAQKFRYKSREGVRARWMDSGIWRYSRHPNYFGELLCWWGLFVFVAPGLGWWALVGSVGPIAITGLLLFVTGIPTLEKTADRKWGRDPAYTEYRRRTNRLVPWPPR